MTAAGLTAGPAPRLTVCVLTLDGARRLPALLDAVGPFADEVVVGVDDASSDDSEAVALAGADRVFSFAHSDESSAARMRIFDHATGNWILSLDDDEAVEPDFGRVVREILLTPVVTHAWFPRKWIVDLDPPAFLYAPRWYPDWQLRLFRNDRALVQKPPRAHSGYHVSGPGLFETRSAILHFEPLWTSPDERRAKVARYRAAGARGNWEPQYEITDAVPRRPCPLPAACAPGAGRRGPGTLVHGRHSSTPPEVGEWRFATLSVEMVASASPGAAVIATVRVRNVGRLAWWPNWGTRSAHPRFSHHLLAADGETLVFDCERSEVLGPVAPGMEATFFHAFRAPEAAGQYLVEWAMVSEGERWFERAEASDPTCSALRVEPTPISERSESSERPEG